MYYTIYLLTNTVNGKIYVGVTNNYKKRMREHSYASNDYLISRAIRKYGWKNFNSSILLETENQEYAYREAESSFIKRYSSNKPNVGYNLTEGGEGTIGYTLSEETKKKMSDKKIGKKLSPEHKKKISQSNMGRIFNENTRKKISTSMKGNKHWLGKNLSIEHKQKLSKMKEKTWMIKSPSNEILCITNMRKFCLDNDLHPSAMSRVLNHKQPHHKGWKSVD